VGDTIRFVDSIAASPTVRLDLNDETVWATVNFDAPPPRLKRSMSSNLLNPGGHVGATAHDMRTLTLTLEVITNSQDLGATELQKLARELDRPTNYLQYQPTGATSPVFFKTYRSDVSAILDMVAAKTYRTLTIEVLADPYALGLIESALGPANFENDPAGTTNPMIVQTNTIKGDVPAPLLVTTTSNVLQKMPLMNVTVMQPGYTYGLIFQQMEGITQLTDTTVVADAGASGGSKSRTTPGTTSYTARLQWTAQRVPGDYRVYVRCAKTVGTDVWKIGLGQSSGSGNVGPTAVSVTINSTGWRYVDLGVISWGLGNTHADPARLATCTWQFEAERVSGTGSLDWDVAIFVPVAGPRFLDCRTCIADCGNVQAGEGVIWDAERDYIFPYTVADGQVSSRLGIPSTGGIPWVYPGLTQYFIYIKHVGHYTVSNVLSPITVSDPALGQLTTIHAQYYPRYLYVRPSAT
jgi:hypothetical protein